MGNYILIVWLSIHGPEETVMVDRCSVGLEWQVAARAWARRSGVDPSEPGWLCWPMMWRAHR